MSATTTTDIICPRNSRPNIYGLTHGEPDDAFLNDGM